MKRTLDARLTWKGCPVRKTAVATAISMFALAMCQSMAWSDDRTLPEDVKRLIERRGECHHWAGEEPYDKARAKQIDKAMAELRCDGIDRDVAALSRKYRADAAVQSALASAEE
jgi:hypothetical protein